MSRADHENSDAVYKYAGKHDIKRSMAVIQFPTKQTGNKNEQRAKYKNKPA